MVKVTISSLTPSILPTDGWKVRYRKKGSLGGYTIPTGSPFTVLPIVFTTTDAVGTLYEVQVARDCGTLESSYYQVVTPCECVGAGFTPQSDDTCKNTTTIPATVTNSGFCLTTSQHAVYSSYGTRIYNPGFLNSTLLLNPGVADAYIYGVATLNPQWANSTGSLSLGPMNREGVFTSAVVDGVCSGIKDPLASGIASLGSIVGGTGYTTGSYTNRPLSGGGGSGATATFVVDATGHITVVTLVNPGSGYIVGNNVTVAAADVGGTGSGFSALITAVAGTSITLSFMYNNTLGPRTIHIGVGVDNNFNVLVNGTSIANTGTASGSNQFKFWHVVPANIISGINYINLVSKSDASTNDALAMVVYDNTASQILNATSDSQLNILFKTSSLIGHTFDAATCPADYSLDISGGSGNYVCVKMEVKPCNTLT